MEGRERLNSNIYLAGIGSFIKMAAHTTLGSPLEVIRMRLQNSAEMVNQGYLSSNYQGIVDSVKRIAKEEGKIGFWKGNFIHVLRQSVSSLSSFILAGQINDFLNPIEGLPNEGIQFIQSIMSGGISGSIILSFSYPLEYARTKLTNDKHLLDSNQKKYKNAIDVIQKTIKTNGLLGVYRGFEVSCLGIFVYRGLFFGLTDFCSNQSLKNKQSFLNSFVGQFLTGWSVKFASQLITYPFYTVCSRMIMTTGEQTQYKDSLDCLQKIIQKEGINSLFRGISINIIKSVGGAFTFILYSNYLKQQQTKRSSSSSSPSFEQESMNQ